jgi:hypothetical protein
MIALAIVGFALGVVMLRWLGLDRGWPMLIALALMLFASDASANSVFFTVKWWARSTFGHWDSSLDFDGPYSGTNTTSGQPSGYDPGLNVTGYVFQDGDGLPSYSGVFYTYRGVGNNGGVAGGTITYPDGSKSHLVSVLVNSDNSLTVTIDGIQLYGDPLNPLQFDRDATGQWSGFLGYLDPTAGWQPGFIVFQGTDVSNVVAKSTTSPSTQPTSRPTTRQAYSTTAPAPTTSPWAESIHDFFTGTGPHGSFDPAKGLLSQVQSNVTGVPNTVNFKGINALLTLTAQSPATDSNISSKIQSLAAEFGYDSGAFSTAQSTTTGASVFIRNGFDLLEQVASYWVAMRDGTGFGGSFSTAIQGVNVTWVSTCWSWVRTIATGVLVWEFMWMAFEGLVWALGVDAGRAFGFMRRLFRDRVETSSIIDMPSEDGDDPLDLGEGRPSGGAVGHLPAGARSVDDDSEAGGFYE